MARTYTTNLPSILKQLTDLGERLRMARLRRQISTLLFAERLGVSRDTLNRLEKGDPNIAIGTYVRALHVLGLDGDINLVAKEDELGRSLQDQSLSSMRRRVHRAHTKYDNPRSERAGSVLEESSLIEETSAAQPLKRRKPQSERTTVKRVATKDHQADIIEGKAIRSTTEINRTLIAKLMKKHKVNDD
ncbi:helix-turn-helix transcriptional regulator [Chitinimonas sp. PSY-7]|uniref:helix-turn-helix domain-containing protein n=1 Tax=Chitinimonas sp. PSY-7 TaxID=3459088 RepID=UPI00404035F1